MNPVTKLPIQEVVKTIPDIIKEAQHSMLGVIALVAILLAIVIGFLFWKSKDWAKVVVVLAVLVVLGVEGWAIASVPRKSFWLSGKIMNAANHSPIADAKVMLAYKSGGREASASNESDSVGNYKIDLPDDIEPTHFAISADGFNPFNLNLGGNYQAIPDPISLDPKSQVGTAKTTPVRETPSAPQPNPPIVRSDSATTVHLAIGSVTLYDGFRFAGQSTFNFVSEQIRPWGDTNTDIGVANPPPATGNALLFLNNDSPPYTDINATVHVPANSGIILMPQQFDEISQAPTTGYQVHYFPPIKDAAYCVRTHDGHHFAKIKITLITQDRISFDYVFQPNGTTQLK